MLNCGRLAIARGLNIGSRARPWCRARRFASSAANKSGSFKKKLAGVLVLGTAAATVYSNNQDSNSLNAALSTKKEEIPNDNLDKGPVDLDPAVPAPPISTMTKYKRSHMMAEFANIAYQDDINKVAEVAKKFGFKQVQMYEKGHSECFRLSSDHDTVIASRGTEVTDFGDIITDLKVKREPPRDDASDPPGLIHRGFKAEATKLWNEIHEDILEDGVDKGHKLYFTGHSLGAAIAVVMASFSQADDKTLPTAGLTTFGCPRVGNGDFCDFNDNCSFEHLRWVNCEDIVTKSPWNLFYRYSHCGCQMYLTEDGDCLEDISWARAVVDRTMTRILHIVHFEKATDVSDHSMETQYCRKMKDLAANEK